MRRSGAYEISEAGNVVRADRRDGRGSVVANNLPMLGKLITSDYRERPVPREIAQ